MCSYVQNFIMTKLPSALVRSPLEVLIYCMGTLRLRICKTPVSAIDASLISFQVRVTETNRITTSQCPWDWRRTASNWNLIGSSSTVWKKTVVTRYCDCNINVTKGNHMHECINHQPIPPGQGLRNCEAAHSEETPPVTLKPNQEKLGRIVWPAVIVLWGYPAIQRLPLAHRAQY